MGILFIELSSTPQVVLPANLPISVNALLHDVALQRIYDLQLRTTQGLACTRPCREWLSGTVDEKINSTNNIGNRVACLGFGTGDCPRFCGWLAIVAKRERFELEATRLELSSQLVVPDFFFLSIFPPVPANSL
ncbi:hypothetical protein BIW11_10347 [Tropilaelaps mercedesae]|uniref:Uncharacterized protein n=1 Tax=Tropilaelaps mercedesae TaxID=418985 RepID=A0A1V9XGE1_9ACAR|nr:hypothetical protein BIW11_10347 [Tropilaelaps mercedesae]